MIGNRNYPLDKWTRDTWTEEYKKAGGVIQPVGSPKERHTLKLIESAEIELKTPRFILERESAKERHIYGSKQRKKAEKAAREERASSRYKAVQDRKKNKPEHSDGKNN